MKKVLFLLSLFSLLLALTLGAQAATVIDSGVAIGGTAIHTLGEEARQALNEADVMIAKGMGNTETMYGCGYNVYYAFLVKCARLSTFFDKPMMTPMLIREPQ